MSTTTNKKFNKTIASVWATKAGNAMSMKLDARGLASLKEALESVTEGSKIMVKYLSDDTKGKFKNPDKAPDAFIEIISAEDVAQYEASRPPLPEKSGL